jgi:hypothetical protein
VCNPSVNRCSECVDKTIVADWVIGSKVVNSDTDVRDPVARAIAEFRQEFLLRIDTELVRLQEREQAANRLTEEEVVAATGSQFGASSSRVGGSPRRPYLQSGTGWQESRATERAADRDSVAEAERPPVDVPELEIDPEPRVPPSDPRQRLDALARLLDNRLKRAQGTAGTRSGAVIGPNTEVGDETP